MYLILLRHGESVWNQENRFTGWVDVDLSTKGMEEAREAGVLCKRNNINFDCAFTSFLTRAQKTLQLALSEMKLEIPIKSTWRLNERHYGKLQGLNKSDIAKQYGVEQVLAWRRSYDARPPALDKNHPYYPGNDPKYRSVEEKYLPVAESLKDAVERLLPYWQEAIAPALRENKNVLVAAHGNSLRGLMKSLESISDREIMDVEIPTGKPLLYELDSKFCPIQKYYLS
ncbi:MAG TPA: 2,3-diphosphoglycerate-dependent phosphoglycerate mutase [Candidatus Paceibacterota bacterium]